MNSQTRLQRWLWFVGLWLASVSVTLLVAAALKQLFAHLLAP